MRGPLTVPGARRSVGLLLALLAALAGLLTTQVARPGRAEAAPAGAVMRPTTVSMRADEILTADVLSNDDPPPGTTWDRSSVCLVLVGGCEKTYDGGIVRYVVDDQGAIRYLATSRFGGVGGLDYQVKDSAGGTWRSRLEISSGATAVGASVPAADRPRPRLRVTQSVSPTTFDHAGQVLTWTSVVTNAGDVPLPVKVTDASASVSARTCAPVANGGTLAPGASTTCTATSTARQDHLDLRADRTDAVRVGAASVDGAQRYRTYASATATSAPVQRPGLSLTATASPTTVSDPGQAVAYTLVARNRGNVTLRDLLVRAPFPGLSALVCAPVPLGGELAPGASTTCRADRVVPAELLGSARLTDTARATARTLTTALNATSRVTLAVEATPPTPPSPDPGPGPVARADTATTTVGRPVVVAVLANDAPGSPGAPLVGSSVRLRLTSTLPQGSVLYGDVKSLTVPETVTSPFQPPAGGAYFLVSGRGEITFVPLSPEPTPELTVGYQVTDADGRTSRSTLTVTVTR